VIRGSNRTINISRRILDVATLLLLSSAVADVLVPPELARVLMVYCSLLMVVIFPLFSIYQPWQKLNMASEIRTIALAWASVLGAFNLVIIFLSNREQLDVLAPLGLFSSAGFNYWAVLVFVGLIAARWALRMIFSILRRHGYNRQSAIIIGAGTTGRKLAKYLTQNPSIGITLAGFFDDSWPQNSAVKSGSAVLGPIIGNINACHDFIDTHPVDLVFLALPMRAEERITRIVARLGTSGHAVLMVQDLFSYGIQKANTQQLGDLQVMDFYLFPMWKRYSILFFTLIVVITLPFWLLIMLAIKAEDGGPVFFGTRGSWRGANI
jgi:putative colanic acid biosynthesis UDP-glucose lipid carrier transferase